MYGPFEQHHNGPTADFFKTLNHIRYMWMPHSDGLYSLLDSQELSLSDLFGSTMSANSIMVLVVEGVARAHVDDDSIEMETDLVHLGLDGTVTSIHLDPDSNFYLIPGLSVCLLQEPLWLGTGKCGTAYMPTASALGLGFSPAGTESSDVYGSAPYTSYSDGLPVQHSAKVEQFAWAYYAKGVSTHLVKQSKGLDPPISSIGIGHELRHWMPDTGAFSHFTSCLLDMKEVEEGLDLGVEVADGHIV